MESCDLLVCLRTCGNVDWVLDTIDSVLWSCSPKTTRVMVAVDGVPRVARSLSAKLSDSVLVYLSNKRHGWGRGLWTLLGKSVKWAEQRLRFNHFLSIDSDTLFLSRGADAYLLSKIDNESIGLVGRRKAKNEHWSAVFRKERGRIEQFVGKTPSTYKPGENVQGGAMLLTRKFLNTLDARGFFAPPLLQAGFTTMADDALIVLWCRYCGLSVKPAGAGVVSTWYISRDPRGLEKKGVKIFHPVKVRYRVPPVAHLAKRDYQRTVWEMRNYFRKLRGQKPLKFS